MSSTDVVVAGILVILVVVAGTVAVNLGIRRAAASLFSKLHVQVGIGATLLSGAIFASDAASGSKSVLNELGSSEVLLASALVGTAAGLLTKAAEGNASDFKLRRPVLVGLGTALLAPVLAPLMTEDYFSVRDVEDFAFSGAGLLVALIVGAGVALLTHAALRVRARALS